MNTIYWSAMYLGEGYETHEFHGKHIVMVLAPIEAGLVLNLTQQEDNIYHVFDSMDESELFVREINKPAYTRNFGSDWELECIAPSSTEWQDLYKRWLSTDDLIEKLNYYKELNKFQKMVYMIKMRTASLFKRLF